MNSSFVNDMVCLTRFLPVLTVAKFDPSFNVHWLNWPNLILPLILPSFLPFFVPKFDPSFNVY